MKREQRTPNNRRTPSPSRNTREEVGDDRTPPLRDRQKRRRLIRDSKK